MRSVIDQVRFIHKYNNEIWIYLNYPGWAFSSVVSLLTSTFGMSNSIDCAYRCLCSMCLACRSLHNWSIVVTNGKDHNDITLLYKEIRNYNSKMDELMFFVHESQEPHIWQ